MTEPDPLTGVLDTTQAGPQVIRGGALRVGGYAAGVLISVVSAALLIRHLGAADFGRYITVISLVAIVGALAEAGMTNIGIREYATREGDERDGLVRNLTGIRLAVTLGGALAAVGFGLLAGYDEVMVAGTAVGGLGLVFIILQQTWSVPLSAGLRLGRLSALELVRHLATLALTVALVAAGAALFPFLVVPAAAAAAVLLATVPMVRRHVSLRPAFDRERWRRLAELALPFAAAAAVGTIYVQIVVILMSLLESERETGIFGAAFRVFLVIGGIPGLLASSAFPVLSRAARDDRVRLSYALQRTFEVTLILGAWLALCTVLAAGFAIDVVAGPGFEESAGVLRIQGVALMASFLLASWGFGLAALHRHRALVVTNAIALATTTGLALVLIPAAGAEGGAIAGLAGELALTLGYGIALMGPSPELRASPAIVPKVALATGLAALAALLGLPELAAAAIASCVYLAVLLATRAIPRELYEALPGRRGR